MKIILIAHNQLELIKQGMEAIEVFADFKRQDIIIVDNDSSDGLREWLENQTECDYLICDAGMEGYAVILNTAIREFAETEDILIIMPNYLITPGSIQHLQQVLHGKEKIGAVSPSVIQCQTEEGASYAKAIGFAAGSGKSRKQDKRVIYLNPGAVLIKYKMRESVGYFDENLILPHDVMLDFVFRGIYKGFEFIECVNAFVYEVLFNRLVYIEHFGETVDRHVLKEKWGMNYFNSIANEALISRISEKSEAEINVLEVGCDCGVNLLEIKNRYPNAKVFGLELNPNAAAIASRLTTVQTGNIEDKNLEFGQTKFDYILFGDVLEHLHDPAGTICYCREMLKKDGKIIACIPNLMHYSVMRNLINGQFTYSDSGLLDQTHIHFFTYHEIMRMFQEEGYAVEKIGYRPWENELTEEDTDFINQLVEMSESAKPFMYQAFQYIVTARLLMN